LASTVSTRAARRKSSQEALEVGGTLHAGGPHGHHQVVQGTGPRVVGVAHGFDPGGAVLVVLADELHGVLLGEPFLAVGHGQPALHLGDEADVEDVADGPGGQLGHESGDDQVVALDQPFGQGQAHPGDGLLLFVAEGLEDRGLGLEGAGDAILGHSGQARGVGHDVLIRDQAAACGVHDALDHHSGFAEQSVENGDDRHIDSLLRLTRGGRRW
jgi:hypothetical protein